MKLIDKIIIFLICSILNVFFYNSKFAPVVICIPLIFTCIYYLFDFKKLNIVLIIIFIILSFYRKEFLVFVPIMLYDTMFTNVAYFNFFLLIPIIRHFQYSDSYLCILIMSVMAVISKYKTDSLYKKQNAYIKLRDDSVENDLLLKEKNKQLIQNQDYELSLATLNERNRISKELHDSIGHLLSRSLIQVGALKTISSEKPVREGLSLLDDSLNQGMNIVRETIHNMRDSSLNLKIKADELINEFSFCSIYLDYYINVQPSMGIKYCFLSTLKESLSNIIKHSDAHKVNVSMTEYPGFYQLVIQDDGKVSHETKVRIEDFMEGKSYMDGMGLSGMTERVNKLKGRINISVDNGFRIFISIPKEK